MDALVLGQRNPFEKEGPPKKLGPPEDRAQLLLAIANPAREFGLRTEAPTTLAHPAFRALEAVSTAKGVDMPEAAVARKKGESLPEGFFIVKVSTARPRPQL